MPQDIEHNELVIRCNLRIEEMRVVSRRLTTLLTIDWLEDQPTERHRIIAERLKELTVKN